MSCKDKHHHDDCSCVCEIVKFIDDIQKAHEDFVGCPTNCLNPILGGTYLHNGVKPNTRVVSFYTKTGELFYGHFFDHKYCDTKSSEFFRVESVEGHCAVVRVLDVDRKNATICEFDKTNQCIVVDLDCFCGIACIEDTFIPGV